MPSKRNTPQWEFDRFAERLLNEFPNIKTEEEFDRAFNKYFSSGGLTPTQRQDTILRRATKQVILTDMPHLHRRAGGKDYHKDTQKKHRRITKDEKQYIKVGAKNIDLKNYDDKKPKFRYIGKIKNKTVYATLQTISIKGKPRAVYRDRRGRFVKRISKG